MSTCPLYLKDYEKTWNVNHKQAILQWFADAGRGLFLHYGLYSLVHEHEWLQARNRIPVAVYEKLADAFTAERFDADFITDFALENGLKYINLTTCHHDSFCLWDSKIEPFNSMNSPAKRDLVQELSEACDKKGLGFFAYYTFMQNWRHPYFVTREEFSTARPAYNSPDPHYLYKSKDDFKYYIDYIEQVMDELLSNYKITGIWLDLISAWWKLGRAYIPIDDIYAHIREKHPDVLISWKSGATGTEDFASPEHNYSNMTERIRQNYGDEAADIANRAFQLNAPKHNEICTSVQLETWGYCPKNKLRSAEDIVRLLHHAKDNNCNLLINIGPMWDGSLDPAHTKLLAEAIKMYDEGAAHNPATQALQSQTIAE